jgi:hypothetical protein
LALEPRIGIRALTQRHERAALTLARCDIPLNLLAKLHIDHEQLSAPPSDLSNTRVNVPSRRISKIDMIARSAA